MWVFMTVFQGFNNRILGVQGLGLHPQLINPVREWGLSADPNIKTCREEAPSHQGFALFYDVMFRRCTDLPLSSFAWIPVLLFGFLCSGLCSSNSFRVSNYVFLELRNAGVGIRRNVEFPRSSNRVPNGPRLLFHVEAAYQNPMKLGRRRT